MVPVHAIRLSELSLKVGEAIRRAFQAQSFWVIADVTNHTHKQSTNYHYFELVEKEAGSAAILAKFSAKAWGAGAKELETFERITGQPFSNNIQVLVNVAVEFHPTYGLQLRLQHIDANFTLGAIEQQRQLTLERLVQENAGFIEKRGDEYITRNKLLVLPPVIQQIAVISSRSSAGLQDFKHTLENNHFGYHFIIHEYYSEVQGEENAATLRERLIEIYRSGYAYDAVVITRGGGAQTDLLIFDNYTVGQAIARFPIPIITGIGHQKNTTIADLMAHTATKTPTKSAEFILAHNRVFEDQLLNLQKTILIRSQQRLSINMQAIARLNTGVINTAKSILYAHKTTLLDISSQLLVKPRVILSNKGKDISNLSGNLKTFAHLYLKNQQGYLGHYVSLIRLVSPENTLKRGFTLVKVNDEIVSTADKINAGSTISVVFAAAELTATVNSKTP